MGIGKREFLKLIGLASTGILLDPYLSVFTNNDTYVNKKLGVIFDKPHGWGFIKVSDFGKLKDKQIFEEGWNKDIEWEDIGYPICIATKYYEDTPENKGIFSPTIMLNITPKEDLYPFGCRTLEEVIEDSAMGTEAFLKDFRVIKRKTPYQLSGITFHEFECEYMFEHIDISYPLKVELTSIKAEHNGFYYDFNLHQSYAQNQTAQLEFERFKQSIKLI
ncbi:hypothetical protein [Flavobacterium suzhouense]|uniref:Uncharacterized protein n=1 Tax=Flavobacterium suzhouense TaxID=1529638 RepID=A0ABW5NRW9_9FLAO